MAKSGRPRITYVCQQCGSQTPRWEGRCSDCGAWNSLVETAEAPTTNGGGYGARSLTLPHSQPVALPQLAISRVERQSVPIGEFNRVLGGGIVPGSVVLVGGDPGIGKCVTGDTRVLDPESGSYVPITAWAVRKRSVVAVDEQTLQLAPAMVSLFHERGTQPIVEVKTGLGRILRCTPDHPLLTPEGWKSVHELKAGSRIAAPRELPYFGHEPLPEATIKLIAYSLSDGSAQGAINVTTCLPEVVRDLEEIAAAFNMKLVCYDKPGNRAKQYRFVNEMGQRPGACQEVAAALRRVKARVNIRWAEWARRAGVSYAMLNVWRQAKCVPSAIALRQLADAVDVPLADLAPEARDRAEAKTPIARLLEELGIRFARAADKAVPECVFRLPREQLALFLRALFTCDGSVYVNQCGLPGISYCTISRRLAEDVQHLLLRYGLVATLRTKRLQVGGRAQTAYELVVLGVPEVQRFLAAIGIMGRPAVCEQVGVLATPRLPSTRRDTIPTGEPVGSHIKMIGDNSSFTEISRQAGVTFKNRRHDRPICRSTVAHLADALSDSRLRALAYGDVYWDEIVSVHPAGKSPVYDLTVPGKANFVANDLIIHNSTLLIQVSAAVAEQVGKVLYVSGEESAEQVKLRAERLGISSERLYLLAETSLDQILTHIDDLRPALVVIDSIQTMYLEAVPSAAGSVTQVRECAMALVRLAKHAHVPIFLVGHVTKEGAIAGPRVLEHIVDTVLYLEGERFHSYRLLRGVKNRFGSTNEVGVFEMQGDGMSEVLNPSAVFLAERAQPTLGSSVAVTLEGTRPILVEIQALTTTTTFGLPRRTANGIDLSRLLMLAAVLTKRVGLGLSNQDIYVNVVGGLKIAEPAADLAVAVAVASSFRELPIASDLAIIGEVGLSGELRRVTQLEKRLGEASKLGFRRCLLPRTADRPHLGEQLGIETIPVDSVGEAIEIAWEPAPLPGES